MCLSFTPNPSCKAVYLSRTIFISFWCVCVRIIISIKFFTIGNFVIRTRIEVAQNLFSPI